MAEEFAVKRKRFSVEQIVAVLEQAELGLPVADRIRQVGISAPALSRWSGCIAAPSTTKARRAPSSKRFPATVGPYAVKTLGLPLGFVHEAVSADWIDREMDEIVGAVAANGPTAVKACKELAHDVAGRSIDAAPSGSCHEAEGPMRAPSWRFIAS